MVLLNANQLLLIQLLNYNDFIVSNFNQGVIVEVVYTDLVRALGTVNIKLIIRKLAAYGINSLMLKWFESYLRERLQYVKVRGFVSYRVFQS